MNCIQCGRRCQKTHTILVLESESTNAWRVECCGTCKQRHNNRHRKRRSRKDPMTPGEVIWLLIALTLVCVLLANGTICAMLSNLATLMH